jgi:hypothetical protein
MIPGMKKIHFVGINGGDADWIFKKSACAGFLKTAIIFT